MLKSSEEEKKEEEVKKTLEQHDSIVTQYKELIREQVKIHQTISHSLILSHEATTVCTLRLFCMKILNSVEEKFQLKTKNKQIYFIQDCLNELSHVQSCLTFYNITFYLIFDYLYLQWSWYGNKLQEKWQIINLMSWPSQRTLSEFLWKDPFKLGMKKVTWKIWPRRMG